jgi:hypothetical protein
VDGELGGAAGGRVLRYHLGYYNRFG